MNEELQKQLVEILRGLKEGASPAWAMLIEQRSTYCLTIGWMFIAIFALLVVVSAVLLTRFRGQPFTVTEKQGDYWERKVATPRATCVAAGSVAGALAMIPLVLAFLNIAEGMAPLGRVLEVLR